jgi:catechol 2,3-dioxygenase-like lactoylglutathione lyase family enzyme
LFHLALVEEDMAVTGLDHLFLETHDFAKTRQFWEAVGFRLIDQWGEGAHRAGRFSAGDLTIVVAEVSQEAPPRIDIYLAVDESVAMMQRLQAAGGVTITKPLHHSHWGTELIGLKDADGRAVWLEERPD